MRQGLQDDLKINLSEAELSLIRRRVNSTGFVLYESDWTINEKLIAWRTSFELSQRQMAVLTSFAHQTICRWEKNYRKPHYKNVIHIKRILAQLAKILRQ
jgi:DNA-binding XRE family transcriptional regulator